MKIAGIELTKAGYKPPKSEVVEAAKSTGESDTRYPEVYVDDKVLPAIKNKEVKDKLIMVAVVNIKRRSEEETEQDGKKETRVNCSLQILSAGFKPYSKDEAEDDDISGMDTEELLKKKLTSKEAEK